MDMYKLKFTKLQNEIFRLLCIRAGDALNQRQIAKALGVSPTAVGKSLKLLEKEGLAIAEKAGSIRLISVQLNRDNPKAIEFKRVENIRMIYESGILEYLAERFPGCSIILFGSYSSGQDRTGSDIDLAVMGTKGKPISIEKFENLYERRVSVHFYSDPKGIGKNMKESIANGIPLRGAMEL